ncbi:MAG: hypothetical protein V4673_04585 [Pseudomonadota bacterium]
MPALSIFDQVSSFNDRQDKVYLTSYHENGFEIGFGRQGSYSGHSHLRFVDIIFSPAGIRYDGAHADIPPALVVVPARTYLPDVTIGLFGFLKFCQDGGPIDFPEKVDYQLNEGKVLAFIDQAKITFPWYRKPGAKPGEVILTLAHDVFTIEFSNGHSFIIGK